ncbi:winged helix-turn-helix domain-containing protein [Corynebacterium guaraldiae]|uniref:winged helix-turn-helix domain-containing protein n=1 Tax=Corynebacterium guaraldiae TaxID=3051103 RepID=UPI0024B38781|nr:winged helix-turn-helix domain-containing protein [Corynebacterium guaraldiae]
MALRGTQQHSIIADYLRNLIRSKKLSPGDFLPSEAELCQQFSSSRGPVRQAVAALRSEGLIPPAAAAAPSSSAVSPRSPSTPSTP